MKEKREKNALPVKFTGSLTTAIPTKWRRPDGVSCRSDGRVQV